MASSATKSPGPRTITVLLQVDDHGNPLDADFDWARCLDRQEELRAGMPIDPIRWRTGGFSTLKPGDRIFMTASHPDRENEPDAPKQRAIIGYGEATEPSEGNHVVLRPLVALKPIQVLPKRTVEEELPNVILWDKPNGKDITDYHDRIKVLFDTHLAKLSFFHNDGNNDGIAYRSSLPRTPDLKRRKLVEDNAIDLVWNRFEKLGYEIKNRQNDNCGWDLEAIRGWERLKLEVKGLSGTDLNADLTVNEFEKMEASEHLPDYRACVLLDALRPTEANLQIIAHDPISKHWRNQDGRKVNVQRRTAARLIWSPDYGI
jgi:Domain of unknown function (DUF3883)